MKFKLYSGLGGSFGGTTFQGEYEFKTKEEAEMRAWELACTEYEQYEDLHGIRSIETIMEEDETDRAEAEMIYNDERESYLDYRAEEI